MLKAAPLLALLACTPSFEAASDVHDLRILAVQAEPPEAQFSDAGVDDVRVQVLAVDPSAPGQAATMTGTLCGSADAGVCDGTPPQFPLTPQTNTIGGLFGALIRIPADVVAAALSSDKLAGLGGIRVILNVSVDDGDPHGPATAEKILIYSPAGHTPNHNPAVSGVRVTSNGQAISTLAPGATIGLTKGTQLGLRPLLVDGSRETYTTTDLNGNTVTLTEDPRYFFFVTPGAQLNRDTADEPVDGTAPPDGLTQLEATGSGASGTLWIVVRDGRGGESWVQFSWKS